MDAEPKKKRKPNMGVVNGSITLHPDLWRVAKKLGDGYKSRGIAKALKEHKHEPE